LAFVCSEDDGKLHRAIDLLLRAATNDTREGPEAADDLAEAPSETSETQ